MSDNETAPAAICTPLPPYSNPSAGDAIIRTSDGRRFYVRKAHLITVGLDRNGVLSDVQPAQGSRKATITVQETAAVWEKVLRMCLMHEEQPYTLEDVAALLEVGHKYDISGMPSRLRYTLVQPAFLDNDPVGVFLVASAYGLHDMAKIAARRTLDLTAPHRGPFGSLKAGSAADYQRLLAYREECGRVASAVTQPPHGGAVLPGWIVGNLAHWKPLSTTCVGGCWAKCKTLLVGEGGERPATVYVRIRESCIAYLETLGMMLAEQPRASLAFSPELIEPVISSAVGCAHCAKTIYPNCVTIARALEVEIEKAISKVKLAL